MAVQSDAAVAAEKVGCWLAAVGSNGEFLWCALSDSEGRDRDYDGCGVGAAGNLAAAQAVTTELDGGEYAGSAGRKGVETHGSNGVALDSIFDGFAEAAPGSSHGTKELRCMSVIMG